MEAITFEDLGRDDHDEVRGIILAGLGEHWGSVDDSFNPDLNDMLTSYAAGRTVVARDASGRIVGTGTVLPRPERKAEVIRMSVRRDVRGTGIGRQILTELSETARRWGSEQVILETSTAWTEVVEFYLRCGFSITHIEEGEFGSDTWFSHDLRSPS